jgi:hypothetical protein
MVCSLTGGHFHGLREPQRGMMTFWEILTARRPNLLIGGYTAYDGVYADLESILSVW